MRLAARFLVLSVAALVAFSTTSSARAQPRYALHPDPEDRRTRDVSVDLDVQGQVQVATGTDKALGLKLSVEGRFHYLERPLRATAGDVESLRSVRLYETAAADISVRDEKSSPKLRPQIRLIVAEGRRGGATLFSPTGPMTRGELDLLEMPGDSLFLHTLLPAEEIAVGQTWTPSEKALQALLGLEVIGEHEVTCTLTGVEDQTARVEMKGKASGAELGASTDLEITGTLRFDLREKIVSRLELNIQEKRSVGHVTPGLEVEATVRLTQRPTEAPPEFSGDKLDAIPSGDTATNAPLIYEAPDESFRFYHDRDWYIFYEGPDATVLRLVDRGELIAQCTVSPVAPAEPGKHTDPNRFRQEVQKALGGQFERFIQAATVPTNDDRWIYRLAAVGAAEKVPIQWVYYLVAAPSGDQVAFVFTLEGKLTDRFGSRDLSMVGTLEFIPPTKEKAPAKTAGKETAPAAR